ncbi:MAG: transcription elongation factor GreA [Firmicutes bacterium]|nr:transcription elongation factor GreA [Bacillota bacterium]
MAEKEVFLTPEGLEKLEKELETLKTAKRREIAQKIKESLEFGDITENSEYNNAKNEQAFVEGRIIFLEKLLRNAKIIYDDDHDGDEVVVGRWVTVRDLETGEILKYKIVGSAEANPAESKISNESPVGQALIGKTPGVVVDVEVFDGILQYELLEVSR